MKTIGDARAHYRFVGEGIERCVADGEDLFPRFEGLKGTDPFRDLRGQTPLETPLVVSGCSPRARRYNA